MRYAVFAWTALLGSGLMISGCAGKPERVWYTAGSEQFSNPVLYIEGVRVTVDDPDQPIPLPGHTAINVRGHFDFDPKYVDMNYIPWRVALLGHYRGEKGVSDTARLQVQVQGNTCHFSGSVRYTGRQFYGDRLRVVIVDQHQRLEIASVWVDVGEDARQASR